MTTPTSPSERNQQEQYILEVRAMADKVMTHRNRAENLKKELAAEEQELHHALEKWDEINRFIVHGKVSRSDG